MQKIEINIGKSKQVSVTMDYAEYLQLKEDSHQTGKTHRQIFLESYRLWRKLKICYQD